MNSGLHVELSAGYGSRTVLEQISFLLQPGERLGLLGGSGSGKSTLLLAILGLLPWRGGWARGSVEVNGFNLLALSGRQARELRGRSIAFVPQSPSSALNSALSLRTHFEQAWRAHRRNDEQALQARLEALLRRVQLPSDAAFLKRRADQVSIGQAQRAVIALALLHRPSVLVADEPTSALDPLTAAEVLHLLHEVTAEEQTALLSVSHDILSVLQLCTRVAILDAGCLVENLPVDRLHTAQSPYTKALLDALPFSVQDLRERMIQAARYRGNTG